ncbi:transcription factor Zn, C2H2 [Hirsutella rhossiliensis]|uniref:Transcription factor Zn, C2H2 n=1 Tax=Hirsutella rhossiliensis TaxID=111463 RepID=A0A9P8SNU7_9HYPO|nr:transcription factor Zn, C2H2 [Hirsutella rhossiliensis]KAH0968255.1 transcription factor Zn, C2H2 [Hirsutella rhossiliensis]
MSAPKSVSRDIRRYFAATPVMPPATTTLRPSSPAGSVDEQDPLFSDTAQLRLPELRPGRAPPQAATSINGTALGRSRIAVVLSASPRKRPASAGPGRRRHNAGASPPLKRPAGIKETPVPLPKIPGWAATPSRRSSAQPASAPETMSSRGRPKGWKAGMSYSDMRGNSLSGARVRHARAKAPAPGFAKRRGRPPKTPSPPPGEIYRRLEPQFVAFLCEWAGCKAELHNLDTLRRHIYVVHGHSGGTGPRCCRWRKCASAQPAREFTDSDEFREHMEEAHLVPLAWHVGDGPQNGGHDARRATGEPSGGGGDDDIPDFLKDAQGNQVTPSVRDQEVEDVITWRMNRRRLKELLARRDENLPDDDSESGGPDET